MVNVSLSMDGVGQIVGAAAIKVEVANRKMGNALEGQASARQSRVL